VHDLLSVDGEDYIVMEHVGGRTLDQVIPKDGMRPHELLKLAIPVARALTGHMRPELCTGTSSDLIIREACSFITYVRFGRVSGPTVDTETRAGNSTSIS
jgi:hypothetical protein